MKANLAEKLNVMSVVFFFSAKSRRQPKPYKPKKMIKLETKTAVYTACNNGSSSIVTKDGELYMFGKDAIYSDSTCELTKTEHRYFNISLSGLINALQYLKFVSKRIAHSLKSLFSILFSSLQVR